MKLFLFPLGHVLLYPGTSKPLHIYEPRYLKMVQDSLVENIPIAIGLVDEPSQRLHFARGEKVGFVRQIVGYGMPSVIERREDGSQLVLLPGQGKARLLELEDDSKPYLILKAEPVVEDTTLGPAASSSYLVLQKMLLAWLQGNIPDPAAREQFRRHLKSPEQVIGCVASYLVMDSDLQQLVLEADRLDDKINLLTSMIGPGT